ncbi:MAG: hypothetical protein KME35_20705 [Aphanocapsa sp. GSE-SYN-MK-11-07L]|jgi:hypothetical protein|nr:hypothetical protein [Aphanocapsa sp. GSE-SYN-MK-11-07L]
MAFIKVENVVINTNYIAAVRLEGKNRAGEESVSLLIAIPMLPLFTQEANPSRSYQYEWLEFLGDSALALQDYFSSYSNVHDLLPQPDRPFACCEKT